MSTAETFALLEAAQSGDEEAGERVLRENTGLIWSVVRRYNGRGVETEDLYQLGCIGFLKAVKGFDLTYGTQFSTYAVPKIAGEIRRFLRDDGAIKVSRTLRERSQSIYSAREKLRVQLGREPVLSELAEETGLSVEEIALGSVQPPTVAEGSASVSTLVSGATSAPVPCFCPPHAMSTIASTAADIPATSILIVLFMMSFLSLKPCRLPSIRFARRLCLMQGLFHGSTT